MFLILWKLLGIIRASD